MSCGHSINNYVRQLLALLPVGLLWTSFKEDDVFNNLIESEAQEFQRVDSRSAVLCNEIDPRIANELFQEWEAFAGLPDPCVGELETMEERRAAVLARLTATGGQSRQYFIGLAASVGFTITISEYDGIDPSLINQFYWKVNAPAISGVVEFRANSRVNDRLRYWPSSNLLECMINRLKPAHTVVVFSYT